MLRRLSFVLVFIILGCVAAVAGNPTDRVHFGESITVNEGEDANDVVCIFCSTRVQGTVHGDAVVIFGSLRVAGEVRGDSVVLFGSAYVSDGARIGQDMVVMAGNLRAAPGAYIGKDRVVFPPILFLVPLAVFIGIILAIIFLVRALFNRQNVYRPA